ncbi:ABC transporter substrate-binding protein [Alcaligenaceae bacterium]|nr:ABC transporter substrate-binding protein [Alcaligenaceae bacterium]
MITSKNIKNTLKSFKSLTGKKSLAVAVAGTLIGSAALMTSTTVDASQTLIKQPEKATKLIFETSWPNSITLWRPDKYFVDLVNTLGNGHVDIQYNDGGTFSSSVQMFDDVQSGAIDMGSDWPSYWEGRNTAFSLVTSVPVIFTPNDYMTWYWQRGGYELVNELYGKYDLKWFPHSVTSPEAGQRTNKPVSTLDEYQGLRLRQCGRNQSRLLDGMGASAVFTPGGEVYAALDRGVLDGAEFSVPEVDWGMGLGEVTKYVVKPGWHQPGPISGIMINKGAYDKLDDFTKFIMKQAAQSSMLWSWTYFEQTSGEYTRKFKENGTEITRLDDDVLNKVLSLVEGQILTDAKENPDHAKLAFSMYDYLVNMKDWRQYQRPFTHGWVWDSLEDTHAKLAQIAKDHGVYDATMSVMTDAMNRNKAQVFWAPGDTYENNPARK